MNFANYGLVAHTIQSHKTIQGPTSTKQFHSSEYVQAKIRFVRVILTLRSKHTKDKISAIQSSSERFGAWENSQTDLSKHLELALCGLHIHRCYRWIEAPSLRKPLRSLECGRLNTMTRRTALTTHLEPRLYVALHIHRCYRWTFWELHKPPLQFSAPEAEIICAVKPCKASIEQTTTPLSTPTDISLRLNQ